MIPSVDEYRANPGRSGSLAHWKQRILGDLPGLREIHADDDPSPTASERYFKLTHSLTDIPETPSAPKVRLSRLLPETDSAAIAQVIKESYPDIRVTADEVRGWAERPVHAPELWLGAVVHGELVGCAITDIDPGVREASLDWLQVLPRWRGQGIATSLALEALRRSVRIADFATVAGDVDNETGPERVYRRCGFTGHDIWHVYRD